MVSKNLNLEEIERLENYYLNKYYHFLKFAEDDMIRGFKTKDEIRDDWFGKYNAAEFNTGAERVVYSLLNGRGIGIPNSSPVGSDLFFEVEDAYIHMDLKTTKASKVKSNIGDYKNSWVIGNNQNSYKGILKKKRRGGVIEEVKYEPKLPTYYNKGKNNQKICLTYFISILYDQDNLETLVMCLGCMPNGELEPLYKSDPLKAGKNIGKTRFSIEKTASFRLLNNSSRIKVISYNDKMDNNFKKDLKFYKDIYDNQ